MVSSVLTARLREIVAWKNTPCTIMQTLSISSVKVDFQSVIKSYTLNWKAVFAIM